MDGVFSFVIYDARSHYKNKPKEIDHQIFIARDPFGVRPLYIMEYNLKKLNLEDDRYINNTYEPIIAVASELKVLNKLLNSDNNNTGINATLTYSHNGGTVFSSRRAYLFNIKQFQPGTYSSYVKPSKNFVFWKRDWQNKRYFDIMNNTNTNTNTNTNIPSIEYNISDIKTVIYHKLDAAVRKTRSRNNRPSHCVFAFGWA